MTHSLVLACRAVSSSLVGMLPLSATRFVIPARRTLISSKVSSRVSSKSAASISRLWWPLPRSYKHPMRLHKAPLVVLPQPLSGQFVPALSHLSSHSSKRPWRSLVLLATFMAQPLVTQPLLAVDHAYLISAAGPTEVFRRDEVCEAGGSSCVESALAPGFNDSSFDYRRGFQPEQRRFCYQGEVHGVCEVIEKAAAVMQAQYRAGGHDTIDLRSCQVVTNTDNGSSQAVHVNYVLRDDYHGYYDLVRRIPPCTSVR